MALSPSGGGSSCRSSSQATPMSRRSWSSAPMPVAILRKAAPGARAMVHGDLRDAQARVAKDCRQVAVHAAKRHEEPDQLAPEDLLRAARVARAVVQQCAPDAIAEPRNQRGAARRRGDGRDTLHTTSAPEAAQRADQAGKIGWIVLTVAVHKRDQRLSRLPHAEIIAALWPRFRAKRSPRRVRRGGYLGPCVVGAAVRPRR